MSCSFCVFALVWFSQNFFFSFISLVHATDNTRMELIIPGEQHFYMKAVNAAERQRWLVALGSAKACLTDTRTKKEKGMCVPMHKPTTFAQFQVMIVKILW